MGKFILIFVVMVALALVFREVFTKRDRKVALKLSAKVVVPVLIALAATAAALTLSLSPSLKVI